MKTTESQIVIYSGSSTDLGSCNACSRYYSSIGPSNHRVYEVTLRSIGFRLCPNCKDDLLSMFKKLEP